jgi:hypothetical protein
MLVSSVNLGDILGVMLFAAVALAMLGVFLIALVRLIAGELAWSSALRQSQGVTSAPALQARVRSVRWETFLFVAGVVGFLVSLSTASTPGLHAPQILTALMILVGAAAFVARG